MGILVHIAHRLEVVVVEISVVHDGVIAEYDRPTNVEVALRSWATRATLDTALLFIGSFDWSSRMSLHGNMNSWKFEMVFQRLQFHYAQARA
jgi:hypothetical protein